ncbi:hypothetical protein Cgig2_016992 [Carnegiea gigantea]|uniref:F-box/LRR-repeat protein 15-like leucin rich repeat domain-containing protein n=1 Tax=Carnegiea gigantea TaxID=171969 RepID=A0A9Q1KHD6_9CARY|nr:hypothetical protein Cgig2_016992 [Carnegiea gigantea]
MPVPEEEECCPILSLLTDDLLTRIHSHLPDPTHRKSFRLVCQAFHQVDLLARTHLRPLRPDFLPTLIARFSSLQSLDLSVCPRLDDSLAAAISAAISAHRRRLKVLGLSRATGLTPLGLKTLVSGCAPYLEAVDASYWCQRFGDREALALSFAAGLKELRLDKSLAVTDVGLARIAVGCPCLERLSLKWCLEITELGVDLLAKKCLQLKFLDISSLKVTSSSLSSIAMLPKLESLIMVGCVSVDDAGLLSLSNGCPSLKEVDMSRCDGITSAGLCSLIKGHPDLLQLNASHCMVALTFALLDALKNLKFLNVFRVDGARVCHSTFQTINTNRWSLVELGLSKCIGLGDFGITWLITGCANLKVLNLSCCDSVTDAAIAAIAGSCIKLRSLKLESCGSITEESLELLSSSCFLLEELDLTDCCGVNDMALSYLSRCTELKFLKLGLCNNISDKGLIYIALKCSKICELDLYCCPDVGDDGMAVLSIGCNRLKKLNVSYCSSFTDKGMEYIGRLEELCELEMRGLMNVTGAGLQAIAAGCKRLTELDLKHCGNIQDSGFWALACYSKNMRQINLSCCAISDVGLWMIMSNLSCLQDAKLVHLPNVSVGGFEVALRACSLQLKKVKLVVSLKFSLSHEVLQLLWSRGCKVRWD